MRRGVLWMELWYQMCIELSGRSRKPEDVFLKEKEKENIQKTW